VIKSAFIIIYAGKFYPFSNSDSEREEAAPNTSLRPVAGPVGYLFPGLTVYLVDILGKAESLAAFHAAQAGGPSPDQKFQLAFAISAFHGRVLWPSCRYHLQFYFSRYLFFLESAPELSLSRMYSV